MSQAETSVHDFEFTLEGADELTAEISDAIYEAGCDDASLSGCGPILSLSFHREAASYDEAEASARADVARTGLGLAVTRVARLTTYSFDVVLAGVTEVTDAMTDALFKAGCDDAGVGSCDGTVTLGFERLDESLGDAIGRAVKNVEWAGFAVARVDVGRL
jgi:hypothetical protein